VVLPYHRLANCLQLRAETLNSTAGSRFSLLEPARFDLAQNESFCARLPVRTGPALNRAKSTFGGIRFHQIPSRSVISH